MGNNTKTYAVVGNSGSILNSDYGSLIDSHDYVIRFNQAPVEGFENHVGSKTSLRIVNCHMFNSLLPNSTKENEEVFSKYDPNYALKLENENILIKDPISINLFSNVFNQMRANGCEVSILDQEITVTLRDAIRLTGKNPSSGMLGVYLALRNSNAPVSCFGFSFYDDPWESKHYYEHIKPYNMQESHSFDCEKKWIDSLEEEGKVKVYK